MADTVISDALPGIQDEGLPNISDGNEDWGSAGLRMVLAQAVDSGSYVRSDTELTFTNHDGANDQVDVTAGIAYLDLTGETVNIQSVFGGTSPPSYDTALPTLPAIPVIVPTAVADLAVQSATLSDVWLAYATDGTVTGVDAGDVYLRSDDTGTVTAPPHPNVKLGSANPDDASADSLTNRFGSPEFNTVTADSGTIDTLSGTSADYDSVNTERVGSAHHYAEAYSGADADARLDSALSAASNGDTIYLENGSYLSDRTISKRITFKGSSWNGAGADQDTTVRASWTCNSQVRLTGVYLRGVSGDTVAVNGRFSRILNCSLDSQADIRVSADNFIFTSNDFGNVIFESGTSSGIVDSCSVTSVTDNGTNTVGDIS